MDQSVEDDENRTNSRFDLRIRRSISRELKVDWYEVEIGDLDDGV